MPKLKVISSGSIGNGYILECDNETLLIECGMPFKDVLSNLNDVTNVVGCVVSHSHGDHAKYIPQFQKYGISVYSNKDVCDKYKGVKLLPLKKKTKIGGFTIQPISVNHNVECYSFLIEHEDIGRMIFLTDLSDFPYKIKDLNLIMIEANYSNDVILSNGIDNNKWSVSQSENHLSIEQTIEILKNNYSTCLQQIILLHLSNGNSNAKEFVESVKFELGFNNVVVAESGLIVELNKEEF